MTAARESTGEGQPEPFRWIRADAQPPGRPIGLHGWRCREATLGREWVGGADCGGDAAGVSRRAAVSGGYWVSGSREGRKRGSRSLLNFLRTKESRRLLTDCVDLV
jgi:hypothetical protein